MTRRAVDFSSRLRRRRAFRKRAAMDAGFARHRVLTLFHIVPGFLFMVLRPSSVCPLDPGPQAGSAPLDRTSVSDIGTDRGRHRAQCWVPKSRSEAQMKPPRRYCSGVCSSSRWSRHGVDPAAKGRTAPRMDDPGVCDRTGGGHDPADRGDVFRHDAAHTPDATRIFRDGVLAGLSRSSRSQRKSGSITRGGRCGKRRRRGAAPANCP